MRVLIAVLTGALLVVPACGGDDDDSKGGTGGTGGGGSVCQEGCVATIAADCPNGPTDQASCVSQCEALGAGSCATAYTAFQACAEGQPITCGTNGIPVVEECATEQNAFIACLL
jgi:hypothetical protein